MGLKKTFRAGLRAIRRPKAAPTFDEEFYLAKYPDVAAAVAAGKCSSGLDHYMNYGWREWRETAPARADARKNGDAFAQTEFAALTAIERRTRPLKFRIKADMPGVANVIIPALDPDLFFGGYIAFLNFLMRLAGRGYTIRFIVMEQGEYSQADFALFCHDARWNGAFSTATMVNASRRDVVLDIGRQDEFFSYSCWTTLDAAPMAAACGRKVVFFIQEYEPTFHAYDSFNFIANSAYEVPHIAIFNSTALKEYFEKHRIGVYSRENPECLVFEHAIVTSPRGGSRRDARPALLFYARPEAHAARNLFAVGILALRECARRGVITPRWSLTGIGSTTHYTVNIGRRIQLKGLPKAPLHQYQQMIRNYSLGLSLMAAPHPGVVHFEWAASGLPTVVNRTPERSDAFFAAYSRNLIPADASVSGIADAIERTVKVDRGLTVVAEDHIPNPRSWDEAFDSGFFDRLVAMLRGVGRERRQGNVR